MDYAIANIRCVPQELGCDYDEKMYLLSKAFHNDASIEEHAQQMLYYLLFHLDIFASKLDYNYSKKQWVKKITNSATSN